MAKILQIVEKAREFQKNIYFHFTNYTKAYDYVHHNKLWKSLKDMGYQNTLRASWEICIQVKKQQVEPDMKKMTGSKLGKEYNKAVYCHPAYLTYAEHIVQNSSLDEAQAGIKIARRNINNLRYADDTIPMAESQEELKSLWWKWKRTVKKLA